MKPATTNIQIKITRTDGMVITKYILLDRKDIEDGVYDYCRVDVKDSCNTSNFNTVALYMDKVKITR